MIDFLSKPRYDVYDLKNLMSLLRGPDGCPWDREQSHESIRRNLLEEAYEAADAIDCGNTGELIEELGDVLMQVVFHADIAQSIGSFDFYDIADATCKKLIRRHPHVFGDIKADNSRESLTVWDDIKRDEKHHDTVSDAMSAVAKSLPALWRAEKIQSKAAKVGFDWPDYTGALNALNAELAELEDAVAINCGIKEELGDILFSAVNLARLLGVDPEDALGEASEKFISRFAGIESMAAKKGKTPEDLSPEEMEELYQKVKLEK